MRFTIIIPAYNSAKYINIPLDSLEKQSFDQDFQVLIINDGSTDKTKEVVSPYLKRNKTWKIINKTNGNWGSVINHVKNKKLIKGDYVTILDSDDSFNTEMLKTVQNDTSDIIMTNISILKNNKTKKVKVLFGSSRITFPNKCFTPLSMPHGKFYKKELFQSMVNLREGVPYQDTVLFNDLMSKANSVSFIKKPLAIWWNDREGNSTNEAWDSKRATLWLDTCKTIINLKGANNETNSWAFMYLWELNRNFKGQSPYKIKMNTNKAKFKWLPFGTRTIAKIYFLSKTKRFIK